MDKQIKERHIFVNLRLCLFGEYHGFLTGSDLYGQHLQIPEAKNLDKAIAMLPDYLDAMYPEDAQAQEEADFLYINGYMRPKGYDFYRYAADMDLWELTEDMNAIGYTQKEIEVFTTYFINALMAREKVFRSLMSLHLFGRHCSGITVNIPEIRCFETALAIIPDYIRFLTSKATDNYFSEGFVDLDEMLDSLILQMEEAKYVEKDKIRFATAWYDAIETHKKMTLMMMRIYLTGEFRYARTGKIITEIPLPGRKNLTKAIANIPAYIAYVREYSDPRWDDGVRICPERQLKSFLVPAMEKAGYTAEEIARFCAYWQKELQRVEQETQTFVKDALRRYGL